MPTGEQGELWQYPYPLNEQECLVTYAPLGWDRRERRKRRRGLRHILDGPGRPARAAGLGPAPAVQPTSPVGGGGHGHSPGPTGWITTKPAAPITWRTFTRAKSGRGAAGQHPQAARGDARIPRGGYWVRRQPRPGGWRALQPPHLHW